MLKIELLLTIRAEALTVTADMIAVLCRVIVCLVSVHVVAAADGRI